MKSIYKRALTVRIWLIYAIGLEKNIFRALQDLYPIITVVRLILGWENDTAYAFAYSV